MKNRYLINIVSLKEMRGHSVFMTLRLASISLVLFSFIMLAAGCGVVVQNFYVETPFTEKKVKTINHGKTTKSEILKMFGPPSAIVRKDEAGDIPISGSKGPEYKSWEFFFEPFSRRHELSSSHIVYYYQTYSMHNEIIIILDAGIPTPLRDVYRSLLILIDNESSIVEDHIIRFGKSQSSIDKESDDDSMEEEDDEDY